MSISTVPAKIVMRGTSTLSLHERYAAFPLTQLDKDFWWTSPWSPSQTRHATLIVALPLLLATCKV
uniref:Uncharacterized protein n=1 Tax=Plectus sambesii TaxID=2011161 RepID=A0A914VWZ0_9BILA